MCGGEVRAKVVAEREELHGIVELLENRATAFELVEELRLRIVVEDSELELMGVLVGDE